MKYKKIKYNDINLVRINRKKAEDIYLHPKKYNGVTLYILPINANPESPWVNGFFTLTMDFNSMDAVDNSNYINELVYYNCNDELGNYLKFYIEEDGNNEK